MTEAKVADGEVGQAAGMMLPTLLSLSGLLILGTAGLCAIGAVFAGTALWLGLPLDLSLPLPPQTLVIGGLFLAVPVAMVGYGLWWVGGWMRTHR